MANDRSKIFFNVLALENILVALTRKIGDGPCFLYLKFSWIGVSNFPFINVLKMLGCATNQDSLLLAIYGICDA